jgi:hypothetical protein
MIDKPFMGKWTETECIDDIIDRIIEVCAPGIWKRVHCLMKQMECESVIDLLVTITDGRIIYELEEANRREIQQADNIASNGRALEYGARTRRKKHFDPDTMPQQIRFDAFDSDVAKEESER